MANRYWVGGTAAWDGTAGTKWATTSGGVGGASVPTSIDDVFFDANSGTTVATSVDIAAGNGGCQALNFTGFGGQITGSAALDLYGNLTLGSGMSNSYGGTLTMRGSSTTIITNGKTISTLSINCNPLDSVFLGSALSCSNLNITNGTLDTTASNYSITGPLGNFYTSSGSPGVKFNGSSISFNDMSFVGGTTINAGTSTINITGTAGSLSCGTATFYNVNFTSSASAGQTATISGVITYNSLSITAPSSTGVRTVTIDGTQTMSSFSCSGNGPTQRIFLRTTVIGSPKNIVCASFTSASDVDFRDITTSATVSGTRLGNCGGNTNITFPVTKTVYWNLAGTQNWSANGWATSSGGAPAAANFPLAQDTARFDNTGSAGTISFDAIWNIGTVDMSARTTAMTLSGSANTSVYGNWTNGSGTTLSLSGSTSFMSTGTAVITSAGKSGFNILYARRGTVQFADAYTAVGDVAFYGDVASVTFDLNSKTVTCGRFRDVSSGTYTLAFGASGLLVITDTGSFALNTQVSTNTGSKNIQLTYAGATAMTATLNSGTTEANALNVSFTAGTYALTLNTYVVGNLSFTGYTGTVGAISGITVYGNLNITSNMNFTASASTMSFRATSGTKTITTNGKTLDFPITFNGVGGTWQLQDNFTIGSTRTTTLTNGTFDLNGKTYTAGTVTTATGTKNITFNGGTLTVTGSGGSAFNNAAPTNFTTTAGTGTGTIKMSSASAKTFVGAGSTFNCTLDQGGAGALTITGSSTFNNITASYTATAACSILFTAATTSTFSNWNASGTAGKLLTITSATAATHTLSKSSGTVSADYLSLTNSIATGGATWYAGANSTNVSGNTGWIFSAAPSASGNFLMFFM